MISPVPGRLVTFIFSLILRIVRRKRSQSSRGQQFFFYHIDYRFFNIITHRAVWQRCYKNHIWTYIPVFIITIDIIRQITFYGTPKNRCKRSFNLTTDIFPNLCIGFSTGFIYQFYKKPQCIIPQSIYFHRHTYPGRYRFAFYNGIHPRQGFSRNTTGYQAGIFLHFNIVIGTVFVTF